jgi:hypothetical protein
MAANSDSAEREFLALIAPHFGDHEGRRLLSKDAVAISVHRYSDGTLMRYVSFGLSSLSCSPRIGHELLLVTTADMSPAEVDTCYTFVFDLIAYVAGQGHGLDVPSLVPPSEISPWTMKAVLFDEARGEDESLAELQVAGRSIGLAWVVPLHASEWRYASEHGLESLDARLEAASAELIDLERPPAVAEH